MNYDVGDVVEYLGHGGFRTVRVTRKWETTPAYEEYGPGFDGTLVEDDKILVWGFDKDILRVLDSQSR